MVHPSQRLPHYQPRTSSWTLTLKRGTRNSVYQFRPWIVSVGLGLFALVSIAYLGATAYLVFRDDLVGAAVSRQVRMQYAYEERIAALRSELDRMTSRHAVQTQNVEQQLSTLLEQQATIEEHQSALDSLVGEARAVGVDAGGTPPVPQARPGAPEAGDADGGQVKPLSYAPSAATDADAVSQLLRGSGDDSAKRKMALEGIRPLLARLRPSLDHAESRQSDALDALSAAADSETARLTDALLPIGANVGGPLEEKKREPEGGPFIPAAGLHFVERLALLKKSLSEIDALRHDALALPVRLPVKAQGLSSRFGYRIDPFLNRPAFHAGLDFVADAGTTVRATAPGTVVSAGLNGGYGEMVEIAHADGVSTRYGHLSRILVSAGAHVDAGTPIGLVGSTGRSTGPHLHYETRRDGEAMDPALYLAAGRALRSRAQ